MNDTLNVTLSVATLDARIEPEQQINATIAPFTIIDGAIGNGVSRIIDAEQYDGEYSVIPTDCYQVLPTAKKLMRDDIVVGRVPAYIASNSFGETFTIG